MHQWTLRESLSHSSIAAQLQDQLRERARVRDDRALVLAIADVRDSIDQPRILAWEHASCEGSVQCEPPGDLNARQVDVWAKLAQRNVEIMQSCTCSAEIGRRVPVDQCVHCRLECSARQLKISRVIHVRTSHKRCTASLTHGVRSSRCPRCGTFMHSFTS